MTADETADDGLICVAIVARTEARVREEGLWGTLPAFIAEVVRADGQSIAMQVLDLAALAELVVEMHPRRFRLLLGRADDALGLLHELDCRLHDGRTTMTAQ